MVFFSTRIQRIEKKGAYLLSLLKDELEKRCKSQEHDLVSNAIFIKEKMESIIYKYEDLKTKYKYENNFEVLSEIAEDYYKFLITSGNILLVSHNNDEFRSWQRKYRLGMLEIENIEKKFNILLR